MRTTVKTIVTFKSAGFNMSEPKPYFINPCCFGDDVAKWLARTLRSQGYRADEPGQEDFGWYFGFELDHVKYNFVIGHRAGETKEGNQWIGWVERVRNLRELLRGVSKTDVEPFASQTIHKILTESQEIHEIRWHLKKTFNSGREELGTPEPI
jgi:hypothetical protein